MSFVGVGPVENRSSTNSEQAKSMLEQLSIEATESPRALEAEIQRLREGNAGLRQSGPLFVYRLRSPVARMAK